MTIFGRCVSNRKKAGQFELNGEGWCAVRAFIATRTNFKELEGLETGDACYRDRGISKKLGERKYPKKV